MFSQKMNVLMLFLLISIVNLSAQDMAIFVGNFTTLSEEDSKTFQVLFAKEYSTATNKNVYDISKAQEIYKENNYNIVSTSETIQVSEYIVISAITLNQKIMLDAVLYDNHANKIFRVENTVLSLDELPNACISLVTLLSSKSEEAQPVHVETQDTKVKQDKEVEQEKQDDFFLEKIIGVKFGGLQPFHDDTTFEPHITIGFNMKIESQKFFIEFGVGPLIPTVLDEIKDNTDLVYGGVNLELGACFYLSNNPMASVYLGGGLNPRILFYPSQIVINPYISFGLMFMRKSSMRVYTNIKIAQFIQELKYKEDIWDSENYMTSHILRYKVRPLELGLEVGVGW